MFARLEVPAMQSRSELVKIYISSPFLFAIECFFSSEVYLLYSNFIAGTPVTSASKAWSGLRPTSRIPS